jgi:hypothetical protein
MKELLFAVLYVAVIGLLSNPFAKKFPGTFQYTLFPLPLGALKRAARCTKSWACESGRTRFRI